MSPLPGSRYITLCESMWHVSSRGGEDGCRLLYMVAHKCQPSAKDQAHHIDNTTTLQPHHTTFHKKLSYRRGTARCVVSVEILPVAT